MNKQKPERIVTDDSGMLDLHSIFFTIQGEGPFAGHRAIFVRLAGCNLQCPGCDTEYTKGRRFETHAAIASMIEDLATIQGAKECLVVITGGEPLRQRIGGLVQLLKGLSFNIQIETNGMCAPDDMLDRLIGLGLATLVVSPKTKTINSRCFNLATCFKYVLDADSISTLDGLPIMALEHPASTGVARPRLGAPVYVNPYDTGDAERNAANLQAVARSCQRHGYILGVQLHKLIGVA